MEKHYFELDKVQTVTIRFETESSYKWLEYRPKRVKKFLGISYDVTSAKEAGYYENASSYAEPRDPSYFENSRYDWLRVDDINKKIYNKANVLIYLSYRHSLTVFFNSNEDAQAYVDDMLNSSSKKFHVTLR